MGEKMKLDSIIAEIQQNLHHPEDHGSPSNSSTFLLVLQTSFQQQLLQKYGNLITMMDGIYRTTKYGFPCFFVTVKTSLGIGRVVATIVTQDETELLLTEGLKILKQWNPNWTPSFFMTDKSSIELGAIGSIFPNCIRLLCDFHRAQAWERWVSKTANGVPSSDKDIVLSYLKDLAYANTGMSYTCSFIHSLFTYSIYM